MHGVLKPEKYSKESGRPTISDSQTSTIQFIQKDIELNLYTGHPPFLLIKNSIYNVEAVFIVMDQIIYKIGTVAAALALCLKIYQVFNLEYNIKCLNFWLFVQKILFEINLECDFVGSSLKSISAFFN